MLVSDLPTPALLVDRARLLANLDGMQAHANAAGVSLRPHAKTHKSPDIARLQMDRGAVGVTVATIDEVEAFAAAGFQDIRMATPVVGADRLRRIAALLDQGVRITFTVDTLAGANLASAAFEGRSEAVDVLIEIDPGYGRNGVLPGDALVLAEHLSTLPGIRLVGVLTHAGHVYHGPKGAETKRDALIRVMRAERDSLLDAAARLGAAGHLNPATAELSAGSSPTATVFVNAELDGFRVTELRPGNYVFGDAQQVALGALPLNQCALMVLATVLSLHRRADGTERTITDAGKKILTSDKGFDVEGHGTVLYSPRTMVVNPHTRVVALSEEHGWLDTPGGSIYEVGDPVYIVPNHACVSVATRRQLYVVAGDEVVETWETVAR